MARILSSRDDEKAPQPELRPKRGVEETTFSQPGKRETGGLTGCAGSDTISTRVKKSKCR
jgi:hypothetical protein